MSHAARMYTNPDLNVVKFGWHAPTEVHPALVGFERLSFRTQQELVQEYNNRIDQQVSRLRWFREWGIVRLLSEQGRHLPIPKDQMRRKPAKVGG